MLSWFVKRLLQSLFVVLAMTAIVFTAVNVIGNPVDILVNPDANQAERAKVITALGLDQPVWRQYLAFLSGAFKGEFGNSFVSSEPAISAIVHRLPATLELAIAAMLLAIAVGIPLGLYAGLRPNTALSKFIMAGSILGFSLPGFWVGLLLIMIFAVQLGWLPSGGRGETRFFLGAQWSFLTLDGLSHMVLPTINLALFKISLVIRLVRAETIEIMDQDYIRTARAKGLDDWHVVQSHLLKNIMIPVITIVGLEFGSMIAFSVITETIYSWPGMGKFIIDSIQVLDRPVIVAYLMIVVVLFVVINLIVDTIYTTLDPRVRAGG